MGVIAERPWFQAHSSARRTYGHAAESSTARAPDLAPSAGFRP